MTQKTALFAALLAAALTLPVSAHAQYDELINPDEEAVIGSPEWVSLTLNLGMYQPDVGDAFNSVFGGDNGPYVGAEIHGLLYRIPYVGPIGVGAGIGWIRYKGAACAVSGGTPDCSTTAEGESSELTLWPLTLMASLRIDVLAREFRVPFVFTPKIGLDTIFYSSEVGNRTDGSGVALGLRWAVEFALELDFLERRAARSLDEEYGINHTYLFFQLFGSTAKTGGMKLGDPLAWTAGLGFVF